MVKIDATIEKRKCKNCFRLRCEVLGRDDLSVPITDHIVEKIDKGFRYECMRCGQVSFVITKGKLEVN